MSEVSRETYLAVLDCLYRGKLITNREDVYEVENYVDLGKIAVDMVLQQFPILTFHKLKSIICFRLNYSQEEFDATTDVKLYQIICNEIMDFESLPITIYKSVREKQTALISKYEKLKLSISDSLSNIEAQIRIDEKKPQNSGELIKRLNLLKSKNGANKKLTQDLKAIELEYGALTEEIDRQYVHQETLKYALLRIELMLDKVVLNLSADELKNNVKRITIQLATEKPEMSTAYNYYDEYIKSLDAWEDTISSIFKPFFKVKLRKFHDDIEDFFFENRYQFHDKVDELLAICQDRSDSLITSERCIEIKFSDENQYADMLSNIIHEHKVIEYCQQIIEKSYCLQKRRELLQLILKYYEQENYLVFINLAVIQIEGLFKDLFMDININERLLGQLELYESDDLRKKFDKNARLNEMEEASLYFKFYYNNLMRNKVAHGNVCSNTDSLEIVAAELLLDMQFILHLISEKAETSKAISYIENTLRWLEFSFRDGQTQKDIYRKLLNMLNGNIISRNKSDVGYNDGQQELYWIFNSYYYDAYSFSGIIPQKDKLIEYIMMPEFWDFVSAYLATYDPADIWNEIKIKGSFKSRVKAIMGYASSNKMESLHKLIEVNQRLNELVIAD